MPACENCQAEVLIDAQFCEACGHKIGTPSPKAEKEKEKTERSGAPASPGSLRSEIPFLAGAVDQAKARLDNWKTKSDQAKKEAERQQDLKKQEQEMARKEKRRGSGVLNFLVGLAALCAFVYLLVRLPRKGLSPSAMLQLWQAWNEDF